MGNKTEEFIHKSKIIHSDKYDYSKSEYITSKTKLCIICPIHGEFWQTPDKHLQGRGCPECSGKKRYTTKEFIDKCLNLPHTKEYSFNETVYVNTKTKVKVHCHHKDCNGEEHGVFEITPSHLLSGQGCPKCRYIKSAEKKRRSLDEIIKLSKEIHGNKYDYSLINEYKNDRIKLPILCRTHGVFYQTINNHIKGKQGCPKCGRESVALSHKYNTDDFVKNAQNKHDNFYTYENTNYINSSSNVIINCPIHGQFNQIARNHLFGSGCPKCFKDKSNVEKEIFNFIKTLTNEFIVENDRSVLDGKEIDIYVPSKKIGIEVNGLIWHSEKFEKNKKYHLNKTLECSKKNIKLIHIFEDEWVNKKDICKSRLINIFQKSPIRIHARKCKIKEVDFDEAKTFLNVNHIQGYSIDKIRIGLYYNNELVSIMTFGKQRKNLGLTHVDNSYELIRFSNKLYTNVVGGASKLFNFFIKKYCPNEIISYADRRWSDGNLYKILNFELYNISPPNYFYVINKKRVNRFSLRKDMLIKKYNCPTEVTEHEFCLSKQWYRIYDCGCLCFKWKRGE